MRQSVLPLLMLLAGPAVAEEGYYCRPWSMVEEVSQKGQKRPPAPIKVEGDCLHYSDRNICQHMMLFRKDLSEDGPDLVGEVGSSFGLLSEIKYSFRIKPDGAYQVELNGHQVRPGPRDAPILDTIIKSVAVGTCQRE